GDATATVDIGAFEATSLIIVVDTTSDTADAPSASTIANLLADVGADGRISLREAIMATNGTGNLTTPDEIHFQITDALVGGAHTITISAGGLPVISEAVVIDGTTDADYLDKPIIELKGTSAGAGTEGLTITGDGVTVRALVINRFKGHGIEISGDDNHIELSYIGTDVSGNADQGNEQLGIRIVNADGNYIGGSGVGNLISGNDYAGIAIVGSASSGNFILGNLIGTNAAGTGAVGNHDYGIDLWSGGPSNTTIGGTTSDLRNVISGNGWAGIHISGTTSTGNLVMGNYIGTDITGTAGIGNGSGTAINTGGIDIDGGADNNIIGGTAAGAGNLIAHNTGPGVRVDGATTDGNAILENEIHANTGLAIDHVSGGNDNRQDPSLSSVITDGAGSVTITGTYSDASLGADPTVIIDFFSNPGNDREGRTYLDSGTFATDGSGAGVINCSISATVAVGDYVTATITDSSGNTSEFSVARAAVASNSAPTLTGGPYNLGSTDEDNTSSGVQVSTILGGLTTGDADGDTLGIAVTTAAGNGTWLYSTDSTDGSNGTWTDFSAVAVNSAMLLSNTSWVRYQPDLLNGETASLTFHAWDGSTGSASVTGTPSTADPAGGGGATAYSNGTAIANLTVTDLNDAPTATNLSSTSAYNEGDASVAITDIVVSDVDTAETITATLTLANTATGSLSANDGASYTAGTGVWTITDTVANVNIALANLIFTPTTDNDVDTIITTHIEDAAGAGPADGTITLDVTGANDAPTATNLTSTSAYNEGDASVAITDIVVSDVDTAETITAT
ncbi:MAG: hypothetical protein GY778_03285, partial [bacterium]|nr:hypothetical protein [bacterium]